MIDHHTCLTNITLNYICITSNQFQLSGVNFRHSSLFCIFSYKCEVATYFSHLIFYLRIKYKPPFSFHVSGKTHYFVFFLQIWDSDLIPHLIFDIIIRYNPPFSFNVSDKNVRYSSFFFFFFFYKYEVVTCFITSFLT